MCMYWHTQYCVDSFIYPTCYDYLVLWVAAKTIFLLIWSYNWYLLIIVVVTSWQSQNPTGEWIVSHLWLYYYNTDSFSYMPLRKIYSSPVTLMKALSLTEEKRGERRQEAERRTGDKWGDTEGGREGFLERRSHSGDDWMCRHRNKEGSTDLIRDK